MLLMEQNNVRDRINQFRVQIRREEVAKTLGRSRVQRANKVREEEILKCLTSIIRGEQRMGDLADLLDMYKGQLQIQQDVIREFFQVVRKRQQIEGAVEVFEKVLAISDCAIQGIGLVQFTKQLLNKQQIKKKELGLKIASGIAIKGAKLRDELIKNGILSQSQKIVSDYPDELMKYEGELFAAIMEYPVQKENQETICKLLSRQIKLLQSQHAHIMPIIEGICKCMRWKQNWVFDALRKQNFLEELINLLSQCSLSSKYVQSLHYCIVLLSNLSPLQQMQLSDHWQRLSQLQLSLLYPPSPPKLKQDILFCLSNIFCSQRPQFLLPLLRNNILKTFSSLLTTEKNHQVIAELAYAIDCLVRSCNLDCIEQEVVRSGLLDAILEKVKIYQLYPETTVGIFMEILQAMAESQIMANKIQASRVVQAMLHRESKEQILEYWEKMADDNLDSW